ncbi:MULTISPECIES: TetR/AcrR family transcriptional regulator [Burkholderia cepacia complex]|uniref:TetR/AcrR family transcriptional regulator n=1 Tax=Burkholderia cepacia complex TaxID=87882 RepID=UPI00098F9059|nr:MULTISPECIES: TetR/AcrR family transcriptional regulator [Burkholderia cepacia complex]
MSEPASTLLAVTSKTPLTLRERNKLRVRDDLVDAVTTELADSGEGLCALDDVLRRAGLSKGTFYNHFPGGRDQLLLLAYEQIGAEFQRDSTRLRDRGNSPSEKIVAFADAYFAICADPRKGKLYSVAEPALAPILAPAIGRTSGWVRAEITDDLRATARFRGKKGHARADACATLLVGAIREGGRRTYVDATTAPPLRAELLSIVTAIIGGE